MCRYKFNLIVLYLRSCYSGCALILTRLFCLTHLEVIMKPASRFLLISVSLLFIANSVQANLENNWRDVFAPTKGWELGCAYKMPAGQPINACRSRAIVNYESGIIIHMMYDHRRLFTTIAPSTGKCVSGTMTGSNGLNIPLTATRNGCGIEGGKAFTRQKSANTAYNLPLENITNNDELTIELILKDGSTITRTVDMSNFMDVFEKLEQAGSRGR